MLAEPCAPSTLAIVMIVTDRLAGIYSLPGTQKKDQKSSCSEEVIRSSTGHHGFTRSWAWVELQAAPQLVSTPPEGKERMRGEGSHIQCILQMLINLHDGGLVATPIAVIRR